MNKKHLFIVLTLPFLLFPLFRTYAQTASTSATTNNSSTVKDLQNKITDLQNKVNDLQGQEKTLSSQISVLDNQTQLTKLKIQSTQDQISELSNNITISNNKIGQLQSSVQKMTQALLQRIVATYEAQSTQTLALLITSKNFDDFLTRANYLRAVQEHDKRMIYDTVQAQNDYAAQKDIYASKKEKLDSLQNELQQYTDQLNQETEQRKTLLAQTQGSEVTYQKLLSQAKAQLAGFSNFTSNQGGASLLSGQTTCDNWGCYYNQRDSQWGGMSLNGTQYSIASDGCLITAVAMVMSHYGHNVTPVDINSNPSNFASYYPAYLLYTVSAGGVTAQRVSASIDSTLSGGDPVIVGIYAYGGTHFVVLKSGSGGNYIMNDPFLSNGHDINFSDHYSLSNVFEVDKVVIH